MAAHVRLSSGGPLNFAMGVWALVKKALRKPVSKQVREVQGRKLVALISLGLKELGLTVQVKFRYNSTVDCWVLRSAPSYPQAGP